MNNSLSDSSGSEDSLTSSCSSSPENNNNNNGPTELSRAIEKTIQSLGKHVSRPKLIPKYLNQPPFLFMHDIVTSVRQNPSSSKQNDGV
jgi:hypothetical protein